MQQNYANMMGIPLQPSSLIQARLPEKELIKHFRLLPDLQQFMRPGPSTPLNQSTSSPRVARPVNGNEQSNLITASRRKLLTALQQAKANPTPVKRGISDTESDEDMDLATEIKTSQRILEIELEEKPKRRRGRPRLRKNGGGNNQSVQSTPSPEPVTMPWIDFPPEPIEPTTLEKEDFLARLELHSHEANLMMRNKPQERRRRNVQGTEKSDFHYGRSMEASPIMVSDKVKGDCRLQY